MIQKVSGVVRMVGASEEEQQRVVDALSKLQKKFPENNLGNLGGIDVEDGQPCAWFGRGFLNLRVLYGNKEVHEMYLGPEVEVYLNESTLDERSSYQKPLVEGAVTGLNEGILEVPPGGGKTVMAAIMIARLKRRTLIVTTNGEIADQFIATIKRTLNIEPGFIGRGERNVRPITVAMIQSMRPQDPILKEVGCLILDECHHVSAPSYLVLLRNCPAFYRYGLTGTVKKTGDEQMIVHAALGPVIGKIETAELQEKGFLNKGRYRAVYTNAVGTYFDFISRKCFYYRNAQKEGAEKKCPDKPLYPNGPVCTYPQDDEIKTCVYARGYFGWIYKQLGDDLVRNKLIFDHLEKEIPVHKSMLVLTHRKEHASYLAKEFSARTQKPVHLAMGTPEMKMKERRKNIDAYRSEGGILVAMSQMLGEGFDAPKTSCLVRAMPAGGRVAVRQQTARAMRPQEQECLIIDFVDKNIPVLKQWWMGRQSIYKTMGFKPEVQHPQQKAQQELF